MRSISLALLLIAGHAIAAPVPTRDYREPMRDGTALVGIECQTRNQRLEIGFFYPSAPPTKRMDLWNVVDLVRYDDQSADVLQVRSVERRCILGADRYRIRLTGLPGAANGNWMCGAVVTAEAQVWKNGKPIFSQALARCNEDSYTRTVRFEPGTDAPVIETARSN